MRIVNKQKNKRVKLRDTMGVIKKINSLNLGMLNVDGLSASTFEDLKSALVKKSLDVLVVLETKRRHEELGSDINIDGYSLHESRRSDAAEDRGILDSQMGFFLRNILLQSLTKTNKNSCFF